MPLSRRDLLRLGATGALVAAVGACSNGSGRGPTAARQGAGAGDPVGTAVSRWAVDPLALGSYSYLAVGSTPDDRRALAKPVDGVLFLAGEATSSAHPATVRGAWESGQRAATEAMAATDDTIVVIGAGAAGLAAAFRIEAEGGTAVVVEARERVGGRVHTVDAGLPVDLGASWIHGTAGDPIVAEVARRGLGTSETDYDALDLRGASGRDEVIFEAAAALERAVLDGAEASPASSVADLVEQVVRETEVPSLRAAELDYLVTSQIEHELAADAGDLVGHALLEGDDVDGPDLLIRGGHGPVLEAIAAELADVRLATTVSVVRRRGPRGAAVEVETSTGTVTGGAVVVTVPLGVLKADRPTFDPPLPEGHRVAIQRLGMGALEKCALTFDEPFWDPDAHLLGRVGGEGRWAEWLSLLPATGVPALVGFNAGSVARQAAALSPDRVVADALAALRSMDA